jgi:hypothetical protein
MLTSMAGRTTETGLGVESTLVFSSTFPVCDLNKRIIEEQRTKNEERRTKNEETKKRRNEETKNESEELRMTFIMN